jgi:HSP20 family molecular chaperone IbpA
VEKDLTGNKSENEQKEKKDELESKIKGMERKIKELEKNLGKKKESGHDEESFVGDLVGSIIPGFGKIVKTLEKTSPEFRQKIAETDSEIKHRLKSGWSNNKPTVSYGLSIRPLDSEPTTVPTRRISKSKVKEVKVESAEIEPVFDVFEEDNYIFVILEVPGVNEQDIQIELEGNELHISAEMYTKIIVLPSEAEVVQEKSFKNNVLQLKIKRRKNANKD